MAKTKDLVSNRRAHHDYEILETFEAGIALLGTEIKSLRDHGGSLQDSYITVKQNELWLINSSIAPYKHGTAHNHEEKRERKLLMHKKEIAKLKKYSSERGMSIVPLALYLKKGIVKVKVATAKGKKAYDKRQSIKEREMNKSMQHALKEKNF